MNMGSYANVLIHVLIGLGIFTIGTSITLLPLWFTALTVGPVLILFALSMELSDGPTRTMLALLLVYVLIFPIWPQYSAFKVQGLPAINPQRVLYLVMIAVWFFGVLSSGPVQERLVRRLKFAGLEVSILAFFLGWQLLSCWTSPTVVESLVMLIREFILSNLVLLAAVSALRDERDVGRLLRFVAFGAAMVAVIAIVERLLQRNLVASLLPVTTDYQLWATAERVRGGTYRAQATFDNPLLLVDFLSFALPAAFFVFRTSHHRAAKLVGALALLVIPAALLASGSRTSFVIIFIEMICGVGIVIARRFLVGKASPWALFALLALVTSVVVGILVLGTMPDIIFGRNVTEMQSTSARTEMLNRGLSLISEHPTLGLGVGHGAEVLGIRSGSMYILDNYFLSISLDSGLPALLAFLAFIAALFARVRLLIISPDRVTASAAIAIALALVGFLVVKTINSQTQIFPFLYIAAAMIWTLARPDSRRT
jgi:O-antigen ligase